MSNLTKIQKEYLTRGILIAVRTVLMYGQDTIAEDILQSAGMDLNDEEDVKLLKEEFGDNFCEVEELLEED